MKRLIVGIALLGLLHVPARTLATDKSGEAKEALKELNDFIGDWKGSGAPVKPRPASNELWNEKVSWAWRFKGDDAWLTMAFQDGKYYKSGELRYLVDKKAYQLTLVDASGKKQVYEGEYKDDYLKVERVNPDTKDTERLTMNLAGDGIRLIYLHEHKPAGRTLYVKDYQVATTKEGESLGAKEKKRVCVVSGGLGTIPVSYKGETFYVCCSGCKEAFQENPEKFIKEFKAKKK